MIRSYYVFRLLSVHIYDLFSPILCLVWLSSFLESRFFTSLLISQVIAVAKSSDLVLMVLDASKVSIYIIRSVSWIQDFYEFCSHVPVYSSIKSQSEGHRQILTKELEAVGLRLNKRPPQVSTSVTMVYVVSLLLH